MLYTVGVLKRFNAIRLSAEDLYDVVERTPQIGEGESSAALFNAAVRQFSGEQLKADAALSRIKALSSLIAEDRLQEWVSDDRVRQQVLVPEAVLIAAATEPLVLRGGSFMFDWRSFRARVLALAEPTTSA